MELVPRQHRATAEDLLALERVENPEGPRTADGLDQMEAPLGVREDRHGRGRIVSRRSLLNAVWGYPDPDRVETRTVDMHIAKLRKKLDRQGHSLIETIRGEGYRYSG